MQVQDEFFGQATGIGHIVTARIGQPVKTIRLQLYSQLNSLKLVQSPVGEPRVCESRFALPYGRCFVTKRGVNYAQATIQNTTLVHIRRFSL